MVASRVIAREAPNTVRVFYEYEVPGPNEKYTVAVTVRRTLRGFEARWTLVSARYARRLSGEIDVEPLGSATLVRYTSRVDPGVLGAMLGDPDSVGRRLRATIDALAARVERLRTAPEGLDRLARALAAMVGGDS